MNLPAINLNFMNLLVCIPLLYIDEIFDDAKRIGLEYVLNMLKKMIRC